jgi:hypothetical protein
MQGGPFCDFLFDDSFSFVQKKKENARLALGFVFSVQLQETTNTCYRLANNNDQTCKE